MTKRVIEWCSLDFWLFLSGNKDYEFYFKTEILNRVQDDAIFRVKQQPKELVLFSDRQDSLGAKALIPFSDLTGISFRVI